MIRIIEVTAAFLITWNYSTYDYNYYNNQWHLVDRILQGSLLVALFLRPIFVFPFLMVFLPITGQFALAPGWFSWAAINLPLNLLFLFAAYLFLLLAFKWNESRSFLFLSLCIFAAQYLQSGVAKLPLNWIALEQVQFLLPATYSNGWLEFLSPEQIGKIANFIGQLNPLIKGVVLFVECMGSTSAY